jgi:hypothetical protein
MWVYLLVVNESGVSEFDLILLEVDLHQFLPPLEIAVAQSVHVLVEVDGELRLPQRQHSQASLILRFVSKYAFMSTNKIL